MAGKISDLGAQTAAAAVLADDIEIRDISDLSMAATGTNKKFPLSELITFLQANGFDARYVNVDGDVMTGGLLIRNAAYPTSQASLYVDSSNSVYLEAGTPADSDNYGYLSFYPSGQININTDKPAGKIILWVNAQSPLTVTGTYMEVDVPLELYWAGGGVPTLAAHATRKDYVDSRDALRVLKTGDSMPTAEFTVRAITAWGDPTAESTFQHLGCDTIYVNESFQVYKPIYLDGTADVPTAPQHATSKSYVDTQVATRLTQAAADTRYVNVAGDTVTGALVVGNDLTINGSGFLTVAAGGVVDISSPVNIYSNDLTVGGHVYCSVAPTNANDLTRKDYVDNLVAGLSWKGEVRAATTANITLSAPQTIDGVAVIANERVLVKNQTTTSQNGIYTVTAGAWVRATDSDTAQELLNATVFVSEGTTLADTAWVMTTNLPITVGTTGLTWVQFASSGGSVPPIRTIATTAPIAGGGDLSADRTLSLNVDGVTNTYLANMGASTIKGNNTAGSADPADLTTAQVKTMLAIANTDVSGLGSLATKSTIASADITDGTVANTDLATMAANTVKMNNTAGVASPTDVTTANLLTALGLSVPVTVAQGGSGRATATTAYGLIAAGITPTGAEQTVTPAASGFLKTTSTTALPAWAAIANTDVTGLGSLSTKSTVATADITNDAVDNTKLANMAANSFKGNNTASAADPIDMTAAQAKTLLAIAEADVTNLVTDLAAKQPLDGDLTTIAALTPTTGNVIQSVAGAWASQTPAQVKTSLALTASDVGLSNVTNVAQQPLDADLTTIAGLTSTTGVILQSVAGVWAAQTPAQVKTSLALTATDVGLGNVTNVAQQPLDADLTAIAGLTATTDNIIQSVGSAWASRTPAQVKTALAIAEADVTNLVTDLAGKQPIDTDLTTIAGLTATTGNMLLSAASAWTSATPAAVKTALALDQVNNTTDANKPVSTAQATAIALKVDNTRTITTTAPLTIGGGASADLSVNRTLAISNFTATVAGAVPPPATVTGKFLKDDGTWAAGGTPGSGTVTPAMLANADFGSFTVAAGVATIDAAAVTPSMLASTDFGSFTVAAGVATIDAAAVTPAMLASSDFGDFTVAAGVATVDAGAITLAKMANLAQDQFIGRVTASGGVPETATITAVARTVLDDTTTAAMLTTLGAQPVDTDLTTIAGLTATTGNVIQSVAGAWASQTPAQVKTALALDQVSNTSDANKPVSTAQATADALALPKAGGTVTGVLTVGNDLAINGNGFLSVAAGGLADFTCPVNVNGNDLTVGGHVYCSVQPTNANDLTRKDYVDNLVAGLSWKEAVRAATTVNGTLATAFANAQVIDGVTLATGNRILLKNQTTTTENGIYVVTAGAPTRATDADAVGELEQATLFVAEGTVNADTSWVCTTNGAITPGTTGTAWAQFASSGGAVPTARLINTTAPISGGGALSGDLTLSLAAAGVTNALLSTMAANSFKGNNTGSVAAPIDMTVAQAKTLLAITESDVTNLVTDLANKQPLDTDLTTIAGLTATTGNMILSAGSAWTSAAPAAVKTALAIAESDVTNLVTDLSNKQPLDADLTAIAGQTATTNNILQSVSSAWASRTPTQVTATLDNFTATLKGLVPPPATATGKFLKDDGTWAAPAGGGTVNKYTQATVGGATSQVITHNLASQAVLCEVFRTLTPWDTIECDIERTTTNTITLRFAVAPATNEYTVVVVG